MWYLCEIMCVGNKQSAVRMELLWQDCVKLRYLHCDSLWGTVTVARWVGWSVTVITWSRNLFVAVLAPRTGVKSCTWHHTLENLHAGLQTPRILCFFALPPHSGTLISKWNLKCFSIRWPLRNRPVVCLLGPGETLLTSSQVQENTRRQEKVGLKT